MSQTDHAYFLLRGEGAQPRHVHLNETLVHVGRFVKSLTIPCLADRQFVLVGSGALQAHGIVARPAEDLDLAVPKVSSAELSSDLCNQGHLPELNFKPYPGGVFALQVTISCAKFRSHTVELDLIAEDDRGIPTETASELLVSSSRLAFAYLPCLSDIFALKLMALADATRRGGRGRQMAKYAANVRAVCDGRSSEISWHRVQHMLSTFPQDRATVALQMLERVNGHCYPWPATIR